MTFRSDLATLVLTGVCVVAITVLAVLGIAIPEVLTTVTLVMAGAAGGTALPRATQTPAVSPAPEAPRGTGLLT